MHTHTSHIQYYTYTQQTTEIIRNMYMYTFIHKESWIHWGMCVTCSLLSQSTPKKQLRNIASPLRKTESEKPLARGVLLPVNMQYAHTHCKLTQLRPARDLSHACRHSSYENEKWPPLHLCSVFGHMRDCGWLIIQRDATPNSYVIWAYTLAHIT